MKRVYTAFIKIAVFADNEAEACDAISESLTNNLMINGAILDWQYTEAGTPVNVGLIDEMKYEEGDIFHP